MRKALLILILLALLTATVSAQPAVPRLTAPRGMASFKVNSKPTFTWNTSAGAGRYVLEVVNPSGTVIINVSIKNNTCSGGLCTYTAPTALATQGGYKWRVTAYNSGGSQASGYRTFGIYPPAAIEVLRLVNVERCARSLKPLVLNPMLQAAALRHSRDMAAHKFLSHTGSDGSTPPQRMQAAGYSPWSWGENAAYGYPSAASVFNGWMGSTGHRDNIRGSDFREMGLAVATSSGGVKYWTQTFGARNTTTLGVCP